MITVKLTTEQVLAESNLGLDCFMALIPKLRLRGDDPSKCVSVESPFNNSGKRSLSIYLYKIWMYKDHVTGDSGDIFKYVAKTKGLDQQKDFPKILEFVSHTRRGNSTVHSAIDQEPNAPGILYLPEQLNEILQKEHFADYGCDLSRTQFCVRAVQSASFIDCGGNLVEFESDLKTRKDVYFEFTDHGTGVKLLYNPHNGTTYYSHTSGKLSGNYLFGWYESLIHRNFQCSAVAGDLLISNSIDNTLLFQSLGFPAVCVPELNDDIESYMREVVIPQCKNMRIFFDNSPALKRAAKKLSKATGAGIIEFSADMHAHIEQVNYHSDRLDKNRVYRILEYHQFDEEHIRAHICQSM